MIPPSNLSEHLSECRNGVCGRFVREGEEIGNPGFIFRREGLRDQVDSPTRSWEHGPRTRTGGYGPIGGEMATGVLADEIMKPGHGRIRAMINNEIGRANIRNPGTNEQIVCRHQLEET